MIHTTFNMSNRLTFMIRGGRGVPEPRVGYVSTPLYVLVEVPGREIGIGRERAISPVELQLRVTLRTATNNCWTLPSRHPTKFCFPHLIYILQWHKLFAHKNKRCPRKLIAIMTQLLYLLSAILAWLLHWWVVQG